MWLTGRLVSSFQRVDQQDLQSHVGAGWQDLKLECSDIDKSRRLAPHVLNLAPCSTIIPTPVHRSSCVTTDPDGSLLNR